ncbi:hypothetical protein HSB1_22830 [Halogranum salarium B-1]|uniref:Uncharacterized protein n=1 Tax=Halogranum salarium B-1 TaxID=1210908 RepID=J3EVW4_9EURY|nr:hypothetical protein HSB1_22830 [Halogranum salarium B-1]
MTDDERCHAPTSGDGHRQGESDDTEDGGNSEQGEWDNPKHIVIISGHNTIQTMDSTYIILSRS